jgi:predicted acylesterase/phospholipase RssA
VNTSITEYFSVDTHPDMKVIDAVCMSIAIPFVFSSREYMNRTYVDGGIVESLPLAPFLNKPPHHVYCIQLKCKTKFIETIDNPRAFAEALIMANLNNRYDYTIKYQVIKTIDVEDMDIFDFNMSYEDKIRMYLLGTS